MNGLQAPALVVFFANILETELTRFKQTALSSFKRLFKSRE